MKSANGTGAQTASNGLHRDVDLIKRIADGEEAALAEFYDQYSSTLYGVAVKILGNSQEAEAALQDGLVKLWRTVGSYQRKFGSPFSWAVTIVRNEAIDRLRLRGGAVRSVAQSAPVTEISEEPAMRELRTRAGTSLARLPKEHREALELTFFGGLTCHEVAHRLGISVDTVKVRMRRGLVLMRKLMSAHHD